MAPAGEALRTMTAGRAAPAGRISIVPLRIESKWIYLLLSPVPPPEQWIPEMPSGSNPFASLHGKLVSRTALPGIWDYVGGAPGPTGQPRDWEIRPDWKQSESDIPISGHPLPPHTLELNPNLEIRCSHSKYSMFISQVVGNGKYSDFTKYIYFTTTDIVRTAGKDVLWRPKPTRTAAWLSVCRVIFRFAGQERHWPGHRGNWTLSIATDR